MDYFLLILSIICIVLGIFGCLLPVLPGPPLSYIGLLFLHFSRFGDFEASTILVLGILALIVIIIDYIVPVWGTKKFGGTRFGAWGSIIGLIAGLFFLPAFGPFGVITVLVGPFFGALIGERIAGHGTDKALRAAFGSFVGFLAGTFMKLACSITITIYYLKEVLIYYKVK